MKEYNIEVLKDAAKRLLFDIQPLQGGINQPLSFVDERRWLLRLYSASSNHIFSAQLMPSRAEETMPPAYPAPSPQG